MPTSKQVALLLACYAGAWLSYGCSGLAIALVFDDGVAEQSLYVVGAFVVAWLVGFVSLITPGGLGVREGVLVALLHPLVDTADAAAMAVVARAWWTVVELGIAGIFVALGPGSSRPSQQLGSAVAPQWSN